MKKKVLLLIVAALCLSLLYGCAREEAVASEFDVDIGEAYFVTTVGSVIEDFNDYIGKTVRIEGVFQVTGSETVYRSVIRRDLSC